MKIVLASNNKGKLREFNKLLAPLNIEVHPQGEFNIPAAEEPYGTFLENCLAKARHAARLTGLPAIADDSGICVNALGGAPGVHSARFAGEPGDDAKNNALLVEKLQGASDRARTTPAFWLPCEVRTTPSPSSLKAVGTAKSAIRLRARAVLATIRTFICLCLLKQWQNSPRTKKMQ